MWEIATGVKPFSDVPPAELTSVVGDEGREGGRKRAGRLGRRKGGDGERRAQERKRGGGGGGGL